MERGKGKVVTKVNKELIEAGEKNTPPKKDWGEFTKRIEERRKQGKLVPEHPKSVIRQKDIAKQISINNSKQHDKDEHDH